jgi:hypothetical protein
VKRRTLFVAGLTAVLFTLGTVNAEAASVRDWACVHVAGLNVGVCVTNPYPGLP